MRFALDIAVGAFECRGLDGFECGAVKWQGTPYAKQWHCGRRCCLLCDDVRLCMKNPDIVCETAKRFFLLAMSYTELVGTFKK
jgi:hypothetical protein